LETFHGIAALADGLKYSYHTAANKHSTAIVSVLIEEGIGVDYYRYPSYL
jgi:hypothetical protein